MKSICIAVALAAVSLAASAQKVGVTVHVNQPGLYGRIDIGNVPQPPVLVYPQPVVIMPTPVAVHQRPIYLHVPPGYERHWDRYCAQYGACGQPVYFVREDWYQQNYRRHDGEGDRGDRGERRGRHGSKDNERGEGHGNGHGNHED